MTETAKETANVDLDYSAADSDSDEGVDRESLIKTLSYIPVQRQ